jgi:hypothetical protein
MRNNVKISIPISTPTTNGTPEKPVTSASISALSWFAQATIILALIPFVGYWFTLAFEQGFFSHFSIPYYFVSLNPTIILSTSSALIILPLVAFAGIAEILMILLLMTPIKESYPKYAKLFKYGIFVTVLIISIYFVLRKFIIPPDLRYIKIIDYSSAILVFLYRTLLLSHSDINM